MLETTASRRRGLIYVLVATLLWSLAGVFTRLVPHLDVGAILFGRAAFGGGCGLLVALHDWRADRLELRALLTPVAPLMIFLSATAISAYIGALRTTTVADVMVIYATLPFMAAGLAYAISRERASRRTMIAAGSAMIGIVIIVAGGVGHGHALGQGLSFLITAAFAMLVVLQRRSPKLPVAPINALGALASAAFGYAMAKSVPTAPFDIGVLFLFGLTTITIAFAMFMEGAKHVPSAEASLIAMLDVAMGPMWVLIAFGERPDTATLIGGAFVLAAAAWRLAPGLGGQAPPEAPTGLAV